MSTELEKAKNATLQLGKSLKAMLEREATLKREIIQLRNDGKKLPTSEQKLIQAKRILLRKKELEKVDAITKPLKLQTRKLLDAYKKLAAKENKEGSAHHPAKKTPPTRTM